MKTFSFLAVALISIISQAKWAEDGWVSGGGELIKDGRNPWFLQNTSTVKYCVLVDPKAFHQTKAVIQTRLREAIDYWKSEFQYAHFETFNGVAVKVASQNFVEQDCLTDTDIRFQFGDLSPEQISKIGNPNKFLSLAVRTDYDFVNLRGKGFIYLAADSGPLKPIDENIIKMPWQVNDGELIRNLLVHELGHVFGLRHDPTDYLMNESYAEAMLTRSGYWGPNFIIDYPFFRFLESQTSFSICQSGTIVPKSILSPLKKSRLIGLNGGSSWSRFFGIPFDYACIRTEYTKQGIKFFVKKDVGSPEELVGTATVQKFKPLFASRSVVELWFDERQNVFNLNPQVPNQIPPVTIVSKESYRFFRGDYTSTDGKISHKVFGNAESWGINKIGGVLDNGDISNDIGMEDWLTPVP